MPQQSLISELSGFIAEVEIKRITQPHHPIRTELGNLEELASSIMKNGLLHPIIVRPVDNHFELVAGLRRLNACRILGMKKIPCNIIHLDEKEAYELSLIRISRGRPSILLKKLAHSRSTLTNAATEACLSWQKGLAGVNNLSHSACVC